MKKGKRPEPEEMEGTGTELRYYWARFDELEIEDNFLGIKIATNDGATVQFCALVPHACNQEILELAHASAAGGHFGIQKTIEKLKQRFHWISLSKDVKEWCAKCPTCNRQKTQGRNRGALQPIYTGEPFERVAINIIGPLPRTPRGNRYILTVVDHFTKHVEAYALQDQEAITVARVF